MESKFNYKNFSIVIPIYNEEEILEESTNAIYSICKRMGIDFEIIFSENGSTDNTKKIASEFTAKYSEIKIISNPEPNYGNALKELIKILEKEIETKYLILSNKNPSIFYNTDFEIRKRSNKNKADRLINNLESIPYDFVKQNFYSFPSINDTKRFDELIQELNNLEYIVIEEPSLDETLRSIKQVKLVENPVDQSQPNISIDEKQNDLTNESQLNDGNILNQNNDQKIDINSKNLDIVPINISNNFPTETLDIESAKKRLKDLFFLFNQDLISKDIYEEFALELKQIIDSEEKKNITSTSNLKISSKEALERIRSLRSFLDQGLISKETYNEAVKVLKDIASNIDEN